MMARTLICILRLFCMSSLMSMSMIPLTAQASPSVFFKDQATCEINRIKTPATLIPFLRQDASGFPIQLEADAIDSPESGMLSLVGNASATQGARAVYADSIVFGRDDQVVEAIGNVVLHSMDGDRITASSLQLDLETHIGYADDVFFQQADSQQPIAMCLSNDCLLARKKNESLLAEPHSVLRGQAERAYFEGYQRERFENVELSRCVEGDDSVVLAASQIILDHSAGEATGRNLSVRFFNTPIFYFPVLTFPITDERKSGFLFPSFGFGGDHGFRLAMPYYWNIAPNQDATISADYMATRGTLLRSEYRYVGLAQAGQFEGQVGAEFISRDKKFGDSRYGVSLLHEQQLSENWHGQLDLGYLSDRDYLDDFGDTLGAESADHVPQVLKVEYEQANQFLAGDDFSFGVLFSDFQIIDPLISKEDKPYARLPEISLNWASKLPNTSFESGFQGAWTSFKHPTASKIVGDRLNVRPSLVFNAEKEYGFVRPQLDIDLISYDLDRISVGKTQRPSLVVPTISIDSGIILERNSLSFGQSWLQTLEPRIFYVFVPYVNQDNQPLFDDGEFDLDSTSKYFIPNRFHRTDRVGDTNRISFGVESRLIESTSGKQQLNASLAQMFYLSHRRVRETLEEPPLTNRYSDLFGEIGANLTDQLSTSVDVVWSWNDRQISSSDIHLDYENSWNRIGLSYRFEPGESKEALMAEMTWPLFRRWLVGLENLYSFQESANLYTGLSIGYDACCWATQFELSHDREEDSGEWLGKTAFIFQLQLKDLGGISSSAVEGIVTGLGLD